MRAKVSLVLLVLSALLACSTQDTTPHTGVASSVVGVPLAPGLAPPPVKLEPGRGQEIGFAYEAFLSPQQEPGEEQDTPSYIPDSFQSTAPSLLRNERASRGHGMLRFTRDLSRAYVDVRVEGVKPEDIVMFHIHCGRPDMLGPIMVDLALQGELPKQLADGTLAMVVTNEDITSTSAHAHGVIGAFTVGCPVLLGVPGDAKTIAGMQQIAERGELYFNLHTKAQTFYGDIRGQLRRVEAAP